MKGLSQLMVVILLLLIGMALVSLYFFWSTNLLFEIYPAEAQEQQYMRSRACLSLENLDKLAGTIKIKNCGKVPLKDIRLYVDYEEEPELTETELDPQDSMIVFVDTAVVHEYYATADLAESAVIRE